jgi:molybdopterin/thiamine biosynthesis adenylyltransferase
MSEAEPLYRTFIPQIVRLIGAGGIGSIFGPLIAKCGVREMVIYDPKAFASVNLQVQNLRACDLGLPKAQVVAEAVRAINPTVAVRAVTRKVMPSDLLDGVVIAAVDSLEERRMIFDSVLRQKDSIALYVDGRLSRSKHEMFQLFVIDPKRDVEVAEYAKWLPPDVKLPKEPRPERLAAHTPYGLAWAFGLTMARVASGEDRPWQIVGDGAGGYLETHFASAL